MYTPDLLNRYERRTVPGVAQVTGLADAGVGIMVNSQATYRRGDCFWKEVSVANAGAAPWQSLTVQAGRSTATGHEIVPGTPEVYGYDPDGYLTGDGRWNHAWDGENRLIRMIAATGVGPQQRLEFEYDASRHCVRKTMGDHMAGTGPASVGVEFLYDGWNLIAELNALSGNAVLRSYVWGLDLSGSSQGTGVGGLLKVACFGTTTTNGFVACNGNGDLMGLLDTATTTWVACYEYGPFGELLRATGPMANANPFRFSSKYQDGENELLYYGHRYYNPSTGRWISRDPLGETGSELLLSVARRGKTGRLLDHTRNVSPAETKEGPCLYALTKDNPVNYWDRNGREGGYEYCSWGRIKSPLDPTSLGASGVLG